MAFPASAEALVRGRSSRLGATVVPGGVNFSVFSRSASAVDLLFFDRDHDSWPTRVTPILDRDYHYWHVLVPDAAPGQLHGYHVHGPENPGQGLRFDPDKLLLDPYSRAVADPSDYDWEADAPLRRPSAQTVIYEMHVRGVTRHASSGLPFETRGTYAGLIEKIPYLENLGVTAVELLPVFQFDAQDTPPGLVTYWGYSPVSLFAPHEAYSSRPDPLGAVGQFRNMVKALHRAGIEVILDVVFNHTAEGDDRGPTLCLRGFQNDAYYILEHDRSRYANYSGVGNSLDAGHTVVRRMILDSLRYCVEQMHVDGFGFDLASILARDSSGQVLSKPPVLWDIESDPALAGTKLIAEAWDAAGLYQVGSFVGDTWKEWNGRFRKDVRAFIRAEDHSVERFADRLLGGAAIYADEGREAEQSVNFVTCHDGFTLNDLVSYDHKHNEANGESNGDGADDNRSWNCGVEGPSDDPDVEVLRDRQIKNFLTVTMLSLGVPMIGMGDEVRRSQSGNNNAYCQDNETSWFDWRLIEKHAGLYRFARLLIERRVSRSLDVERRRLTLNALLALARNTWHGVKLGQYSEISR